MAREIIIEAVGEGGMVGGEAGRSWANEVKLMHETTVS
jgi:hypothetical protein